METHIERTLVHHGRAGRQSGHQAEGQGAGQMVAFFPADRAAGPSGCFRVLRSRDPKKCTGMKVFTGLLDNGQGKIFPLISQKSIKRSGAQRASQGSAADELEGHRVPGIPPPLSWIQKNKKCTPGAGLPLT